MSEFEKKRKSYEFEKKSPAASTLPPPRKLCVLRRQIRIIKIYNRKFPIWVCILGELSPSRPSVYNLCFMTTEYFEYI